MLRITLERELAEEWQKTAENYTHMFLSSFSDQLRSAELFLEPYDTLHGLPNGFRCRISVEFLDGRQTLIEAENGSVSLVLEQALSRCRRTLVRRLNERTRKVM